MHPRAAYRFVQAARVVDALGPGDQLVTESVARELTPLLDEPESVRDAWAEAVWRSGPRPTAAQVREVVQGKRALAEPPVEAERSAMAREAKNIKAGDVIGSRTVSSVRVHYGDCLNGQGAPVRAAQVVIVTFEGGGPAGYYWPNKLVVLDAIGPTTITVALGRLDGESADREPGRPGLTLTADQRERALGIVERLRKFAG